MTPTYAVGDIVVQSTHLGGTRRVVVTERLPDVKNGRPGFDGQVEGTTGDGGAVWGYDDQIMSVERR